MASISPRAESATQAAERGSRAHHVGVVQRADAVDAPQRPAVKRPGADTAPTGSIAAIELALGF